MVVDIIIKINEDVRIKKMQLFSGRQVSKNACRQCSTSKTVENVLKNHKEKCEQQKLTSFDVSNENHLIWKTYFHRIPIHFKFGADYEADSEIDNSNIGDKTTNVHKQNHVPNGYYIISELHDVSKN